MMFKRFNNLKIGTRIIIGFLIMVMIACIIGFVGVINLKSVQDSYSLDYTDSSLELEYAEKISSTFQQIRVSTLAYYIHSESEEDRAGYNDQIKQYKSDIDDAIRAFRALLEDYDSGEVAKEVELLDNIQTALNEFGNNRNKLMEEFEAGLMSKEEFISYFSNGGESYILANNTDSAIQDLIDYVVNYAKEKINENENKARTSIFVMISVLAVGIIIAIILSLIISRSISKPINDVVDAAGKLAKGDMDINFDNESEDETGKLINSFKELVRSTREQANIVQKIAEGDLSVDVPVRSEKDLMGQKLSEMVNNLNHLIKNISAAAEQVSAGARQISNSSMELSQGATEQASSIEELTASMEDVASKTEVNANNANKANELAGQAESFAVTGNKYMSEMLKSMDEINQASANINKIIKVIDDIAFQTNILALNAAVEAARAGQYGKGFAVVAEEVRNLAGRSANAAKETADLIEDSIKKSQSGAKIAKETAEALERIVKEVEDVSNLISEIKRASDEQASAITQINQGIMQVSQVVQENSATSEECAAASEELSSQAEVLRQMVERFKIKNNSNYGIFNQEIRRQSEKKPEIKHTEPEQENVLKKEQNKDMSSKIILSDSEFGKY